MDLKIFHREKLCSLHDTQDQENAGSCVDMHRERERSRQWERIGAEDQELILLGIQYIFLGFY